MVKHKDYEPIIDDIIKQKLSNFNILIKIVKTNNEDYSRQSVEKCKSNADDVAFCKKLDSYMKDVNKFLKLDKELGKEIKIKEINDKKNEEDLGKKMNKKNETDKKQNRERDHQVAHLQVRLQL